MLDKIKVSVAALLVLAGVVGYYQLPSLMGENVSALLRFAVIAVALIAAAITFFTSETGNTTRIFGKGAMIELKKMIWPTKQETIQGTIMVVILVIIFSLFLWLIDTISFKAIYDFILAV
ncbi:MAG: preprotein translocase subunit SecE [Arenicella sp.]